MERGGVKERWEGGKKRERREGQEEEGIWGGGGEGGEGGKKRGKKIGKKRQRGVTLSIVTSTLRGEHTVNLLERHQSGQFCNVVW